MRVSLIKIDFIFPSLASIAAKFWCLYKRETTQTVLKRRDGWAIAQKILKGETDE